MDYNNFSDAIATQWMPFYGKKRNIEEDFEDGFTKGKDQEIISRFHYKCFLKRPIKQKAHIILCGIYNVHHDKEIYHLGVKENKPINCRRIIIKPKMKIDLLNELDRLGINGATLGIEDLCVETIATDIANKMLGKKI